MPVSPKSKTSIEFLVDEADDLLLAYERVEITGKPVSLEEALRLPLSELRKREPGELQRTLGRLVLAFLNSRSSKGLGLPRDLADEKRLDDQHFAALEADVNPSDPKTIYDLAVSLIARGMSDESWADIEKGEALLNPLADAGFAEAVKYREEVWSLVRPRLEKKIKRG